MQKLKLLLPVNATLPLLLPPLPTRGKSGE